MDAALLRELQSMAFGFMLVLARVGTTLLTGPGLGENEIPPTIRAAMAGLLAVLVYPLLQVALPPVPDGFVPLLGLLAGEVLIGAWLGFMTRVLVMALAMAGSVVSLMVGLSSVLQLDPAVGGQASALQRMMSLAAVALLFATGLYVLPIRAVLGSYDVAPVGAVFDAGGAASLVTRAVGESFGLALRLGAPFVIVALVWQAAMGFASRMVPSVQVHVVSAPAQILSGLVLLSAAILAMFQAWSAGMLKALSALPGL